MREYMKKRRQQQDLRNKEYKAKTSNRISNIEKVRQQERLRQRKYTQMNNDKSRKLKRKSYHQRIQKTKERKSEVILDDECSFSASKKQKKNYVMPDNQTTQERVSQSTNDIEKVTDVLSGLTKYYLGIFLMFIHRS